MELIYSEIKIPQDTGIQLFSGGKALARLLVNAGDTEAVFDVIDSFDRGVNSQAIYRMTDSSYGKAIIKGDQSLLSALSCRSYLEQYPSESLGGRYLKFMESHKLDPNSVLKAAISRRPPDFIHLFPHTACYLDHICLSHDLWHVLFDYEADPLGEICLLFIEDAILNSTGMRILAMIAGAKIQMQMPHINIFTILREARRAGQIVEWLPTVDLPRLFNMGIDDVRRKLNIQNPEKYIRVSEADKIKIAKSFGVD